MTETPLKRALSIAVLGAAGLLGVGVVAAMLAQRQHADAQLAAAKAGFRRTAPIASGAAVLERDATWRLGRLLFHETALSKSGHSACATCHQAGHGWSDASPRAVGDGGKLLAFKAPTLLDVGSLHRFGWTGRFADLTAVTTFAITSPSNMGASLDEDASRLRSDSTYTLAFRSAFPDGAIDGGRILAALGAYVTTLTLETPFDRWIAGDENAIGGDAKRGFATFSGKGGCADCHSGPSLTDGSFHDIGTSTNDPGRGARFKTSIKLQHAFKTPSLRGVGDRAPYMHDGSLATLDEVVDLYDRGGIDRPSRADAIRPLHLTRGEKSDLIAFLRTLSGETRYASGR